MTIFIRTSLPEIIQQINDNFYSYHESVIGIISHEFLEFLHHTLLQFGRSICGEIRLDQPITVSIVAPHLQSRKNNSANKTLTKLSLPPSVDKSRGFRNPNSLSDLSKSAMTESEQRGIRECEGRR